MLGLVPILVLQDNSRKKFDDMIGARSGELA